ncbi:MAG: MFS transporter [Pseudomonadota bacterium]
MRGYLFVVVGAWVISITYGVRFAFGQFLPSIQREFGLDHDDTALLACSVYAGTCAALLVAAYLTERWGARVTVIAAMVFAALGALTVSFAQSQTYLLASLSFIGIGSGLSMPPLVAGVGVVCSRYKERAVSIINAGTGAGIVAASITALQFADTWRACFLVFALISVALSLVALFAVPKRPAIAARTGSLGQMFKSPGLHQAASSALLFGMVSAAIWTGGGLSLVGLADWSTAEISLFWIALGIAGLLGGLCGDLVAKLSLAEMHSISFIGLGASALLLTMAEHSATLAFFAASLFGVFYMTGTAMYLIWAGRISRTHAPTVVSVLFFMLPVGQIIGSAIFGELTSHFDFDHVLVVFTLMSSCFILIQVVSKIDVQTAYVPGDAEALPVDPTPVSKVGVDRRVGTGA